MRKRDRRQEVEKNLRQMTSLKTRLDMSPRAFGELRESSDCLTDTSQLRRRLATDGYLFFRGLLNRQWVMDARREVLEWLDQKGLLDPQSPKMEAVAASNKTGFVPEDRQFPAVRKITHSGRMIEFYTTFLGGEVRPYDYIWMRMMCPGCATGPHCDIVYNGRGTPNIYTSWTPLGDLPLQHGPLMVLENSHCLEDLKNSYCRMDIDKDHNWKKLRFRHWRLFRGGDYSRNPRAVQRQFGLRWLSTDFRAGDIAILLANTLHGSLDNMSESIRLSTDTRYQLRTEPIDERWVGKHPIAHSQAE